MSKNIRAIDFLLCFTTLYMSFLFINSEAITFFLLCFITLRSFGNTFLSETSYLCSKGTLRDLIIAVLITYELYPSLTLIRQFIP